MGRIDSRKGELVIKAIDRFLHKGGSLSSLLRTRLTGNDFYSDSLISSQECLETQVKSFEQDTNGCLFAKVMHHNLNTLRNQGSIQAHEKADFTIHTFLYNDVGSIVESDHINVGGEGVFNNYGVVKSAKHFLIKAKSENYGTLQSSGSLYLDTDFLSVSGKINAKKAIKGQVKYLTLKEGSQVKGQGEIILSLHEGDLASRAILRGSEITLILQNTESFLKSHGRIETTGNLFIDGLGTVYNRGTKVADKIDIICAYLINQELIDARKALRIKAQKIVNKSHGLLKTFHELYADAIRIDNDGRVESNNTLFLSASRYIDNKGVMESNVLQVKAPKFNNQGTVSAFEKIVLDARNTKNSGLIKTNTLTQSPGFYFHDFRHQGELFVLKSKLSGNHFDNTGLIQAANKIHFRLNRYTGALSSTLKSKTLKVEARKPFLNAGHVEAFERVEMDAKKIVNEGTLKTKKLLAGIDKKLEEFKNQGSLEAEEAKIIGKLFENVREVKIVKSLELDLFKYIGVAKSILRAMSIKLSAAKSINNAGWIEVSECIKLESDKITNYGTLSAKEIMAGLQTAFSRFLNAGNLLSNKANLKGEEFFQENTLIAKESLGLRLKKLKTKVNSELQASSATWDIEEILENSGLINIINTITVDVKQLINAGKLKADVISQSENRHFESLINQGTVKARLGTFSGLYLRNQGKIKIAQALKLVLTSLTNQLNAIINAEDLIASVEVLLNQGDIEVSNQANFSGVNYTNEGKLFAKKSLILSAKSLRNAKQIQSEETFTLTVDNLINEGEAHLKAHNLSIKADESTNHGSIVAYEKLDVQGSSLINYKEIESVKMTTFSVKNIENQGQINGENVVLDRNFKKLDNKVKGIIRARSLAIYKGSLDNEGTLKAKKIRFEKKFKNLNNHESGTLSASGFNLLEGAVKNDGSIAVNTATFGANFKALYNNKDATLHAIDSAVFSSGKVLNSGTISALGKIIFENQSLENGGQILAVKHSDGSSVPIIEIKHLKEKFLNNKQGFISSEGAFISEKNGSFNNKGRIVAQEYLEIKEDSLTQSGDLISIGRLSIEGLDLKNKGLIKSNKNQRLNLQTLGNKGSLESLEELSISAESLDNKGSTASLGKQSIIVKKFTNRGEALSSDNLNIKAEDIDQKKGARVMAQRDLTLFANTIFINEGTFFGFQKFTQSGRAMQGSGSLESEGKLSIDWPLDELCSFNGHMRNKGALKVSAKGLTNKGHIYSQKRIKLATKAAFSNEGSLEVFSEDTTSEGLFIKSDGPITNEGALFSDSFLSAKSQKSIHLQAKVGSKEVQAEHISLEAEASIHVDASELIATKSTTLTAKLLINNEGLVKAGTKLKVNTPNMQGEAGLYAADEISIHSKEIALRDVRVESGKMLKLFADGNIYLSNAGNLALGGGVHAEGGVIILPKDQELNLSGNLYIKADSVQFFKNINLGGRFTLVAPNQEVIHTHRLFAKKGFDFKVKSLNNTGGIAGIGPCHIDAEGNINNKAILSAAGPLDITSRKGNIFNHENAEIRTLRYSHDEESSEAALLPSGPDQDNHSNHHTLTLNVPEGVIKNEAGEISSEGNILVTTKELENTRKAPVIVTHGKRVYYKPPHYFYVEYIKSGSSAGLIYAKGMIQASLGKLKNCASTIYADQNIYIKGESCLNKNQQLKTTWFVHKSEHTRKKSYYWLESKNTYPLLAGYVASKQSVTLETIQQKGKSQTRVYDKNIFSSNSGDIKNVGTIKAGELIKIIGTGNQVVKNGIFDASVPTPQDYLPPKQIYSCEFVRNLSQNNFIEMQLTQVGKQMLCDIRYANKEAFPKHFAICGASAVPENAVYMSPRLMAEMMRRMLLSTIHTPHIIPECVSNMKELEILVQRASVAAYEAAKIEGTLYVRNIEEFSSLEAPYNAGEALFNALGQSPQACIVFLIDNLNHYKKAIQGDFFNLGSSGRLPEAVRNCKNYPGIEATHQALLLESEQIKEALMHVLDGNVPHDLQIEPNLTISSLLPLLQQNKAINKHKLGEVGLLTKRIEAYRSAQQTLFKEMVQFYDANVQTFIKAVISAESQLDIFKECPNIVRTLAEHFRTNIQIYKKSPNLQESANTQALITLQAADNTLMQTQRILPIKGQQSVIFLEDEAYGYSLLVENENPEEALTVSPQGGIPVDYRLLQDPDLDLIAFEPQAMNDGTGRQMIVPTIIFSEATRQGAKIGGEGALIAKNIEFDQLSLVHNTGTIAAVEHIFGRNILDFINEQRLYEHWEYIKTKEGGWFSSDQYEWFLIKELQKGGNMLGQVIDLEASGNIEFRGGKILGGKFSFIAHGSIKVIPARGSKVISWDVGSWGSIAGGQCATEQETIHPCYICGTENVFLQSLGDKVTIQASFVGSKEDIALDGKTGVTIESLMTKHIAENSASIQGLNISRKIRDEIVSQRAEVLSLGGNIYILSGEGVVRIKGSTVDAPTGSLHLHGQLGNEVVEDKISVIEVSSGMGFDGTSISVNKTKATTEQIEPSIIRGQTVEMITAVDNQLRAAIAMAQEDMLMSAGGKNIIQGATKKSFVEHLGFSLGASFFGSTALQQMIEGGSFSDIGKALLSDDPMYMALKELANSGDGWDVTAAGVSIFMEGLKLSHQLLSGADSSTLQKIGSRYGINISKNGISLDLTLRLGRTYSEMIRTQIVSSMLECGGEFRSESIGHSEFLDGTHIIADNIRIKAQELYLRAAQEKLESYQESHGIGTSIKKSGLGFGVDGSQAKSQEVLHRNTTLKAANTVEIDTELLDILGGVVRAKHVRVNASEANIQSAQDSYKSIHQAGNLGIDFGAGGMSPCVSAQYGSEKSHKTQEASGIIGEETCYLSFLKTKLIGGVLAAIELDGFRADLGDLTTESLEDEVRSHYISGGFSMSKGPRPLQGEHTFSQGSGVMGSARAENRRYDKTQKVNTVIGQGAVTYQADNPQSFKRALEQWKSDASETKGHFKALIPIVNRRDLKDNLRSLKKAIRTMIQSMGPNTQEAKNENWLNRQITYLEELDANPQEIISLLSDDELTESLARTRRFRSESGEKNLFALYYPELGVSKGQIEVIIKAEQKDTLRALGDTNRALYEAVELSRNHEYFEKKYPPYTKAGKLVSGLFSKNARRLAYFFMKSIFGEKPLNHAHLNLEGLKNYFIKRASDEDYSLIQSICKLVIRAYHNQPLSEAAAQVRQEADALRDIVEQRLGAQIDALLLPDALEVKQNEPAPPPNLQTEAFDLVETKNEPTEEELRGRNIKIIKPSLIEQANKSLRSRSATKGVSKSYLKKREPREAEIRLENCKQEETERSLWVKALGFLETMGQQSDGGQFHRFYREAPEEVQKDIERSCSIYADFNPLLAIPKGLYETVSGKDILTQDPSSRYLAALNLIPGSVIGQSGKLAKLAKIEARVSIEVKATDKLHKNSLKYKGETHVYKIVDSEGKVHKVGESAQGYRKRDGASKRAEAQVRKLHRESNATYKSEVIKKFENKKEAREYETRLIKKARKVYGNQALEGNKGVH